MKRKERRKGLRGERDREVKGIERVKGARSKILVKSPEPGNKAQRKVKYKNYDAITMSRNYYRKFSQEIITENYQLVYIITRKMWGLQGYCRIQKSKLIFV